MASMQSLAYIPRGQAAHRWNNHNPDNEAIIAANSCIMHRPVFANKHRGSCFDSNPEERQCAVLYNGGFSITWGERNASSAYKRIKTRAKRSVQLNSWAINDAPARLCSLRFKL